MRQKHTLEFRREHLTHESKALNSIEGRDIFDVSHRPGLNLIFRICLMSLTTRLVIQSHC